MKLHIGNIWDLPLKYWLVIPTNLGWKKDGTNPMGKGLAKQATERYTNLPREYGIWCQRYSVSKGELLVNYLPKDREKHNLILFPTKPLNVQRPYASWQSKASRSLIEQGLQQLATYTMHIAIPILGCGEGGLKEEEILPLLEKYLVGENFLLVRE